ncbi:MAG: hypothetical protein IJV07_00665 [Alphaproteobacteria bacterium]|nr:hypothetical protein [Alphaproteobacteria bacterium]
MDSSSEAGMTERFDHTARPELGRSMVEMLGTLAIMGVLTIGGIAGYRYAINKSNANTILGAVSQMAVTAVRIRLGSPKFISHRFGWLFYY